MNINVVIATTYETRWRQARAFADRVLVQLSPLHRQMMSLPGRARNYTRLRSSLCAARSTGLHSQSRLYNKIRKLSVTFLTRTKLFY